MFRNQKKKTKYFNWKKKVKFCFFLAPSILILPITPLKAPNLQIIFCIKFTYPNKFQRVEPILKVSKNLALNSFYKTLTETQKTPFLLKRLIKSKFINKLRKHGNVFET